jgi:hypothetical protein
VLLEFGVIGMGEGEALETDVEGAGNPLEPLTMKIP